MGGGGEEPGTPGGAHDLIVLEQSDRELEFMGIHAGFHAEPTAGRLRKGGGCVGIVSEQCEDLASWFCSGGLIWQVMSDTLAGLVVINVGVRRQRREDVGDHLQCGSRD